MSLIEGLFPLSGNVAKLVLIPKVGRPLEIPSFYVSLCLFNYIGEINEILLLSRIMAHCNATIYLNSNQFGFSGRKYTAVAVVTVRRQIKAAHNVGNHWLAVYKKCI